MSTSIHKVAKMIYGFSGKMGTGKNYICENMFLPIIKHETGKDVLQLAFADQIKVNVMTKYNLTKEDVCDKKSADVRHLLQKEGTEEGRDKLGTNIWVNYLDKWIDLHRSRGIEHFLITDVRFINEVEYIKSKGGRVIRIEAEERNRERLERENNGEHIRQHRSETELDTYTDFDLVLNNDRDSDQQKLHQTLKDFLFSNQ
jgi:phosphomevalonate kinase